MFQLAVILKLIFIYLIMKYNTILDKIYYLIFNLIQNIVFIYYINGEEKINITFNYYTGYNKNKYNRGKYYCYVYNNNGCNIIGFIGEMNEINYIKYFSKTQMNYKRKNIVLYDENDQISKMDVSVLDRYVENIIIANNPVINMREILDMIGMKNGGKIAVFDQTFKKTKYEAENIDIYDLYEK